LFRVLLSSFFERQAFHHADAAFTQGVGSFERHSHQLCERAGGFDSTWQVTRIDSRKLFRRQRFGGGFRLFSSTRREWGISVSAETPLGVSLRLTVTDDDDVSG